MSGDPVRSADQNALARSTQREALPDWGTLLTRIADDIARIMEAEFKMFQLGLHHTLENAVDRLVIGLLALFALIAGVVCLLAGLILFLHRWIPWWQSTAIAGGLSLVAGISGALSLRALDVSAIPAEAKQPAFPPD